MTKYYIQQADGEIKQHHQFNSLKEAEYFAKRMGLKLDQWDSNAARVVVNK